jgi:hypothetical protein
LSPVRHVSSGCRPSDLSSTSALRFNDHPCRVRDDGLHHIAGLAASATGKNAFCASPKRRPPGASREVPAPSAFSGRTALPRVATPEAIPLQPCAACPRCAIRTREGAPAPAVFRQRSRRDLATSSAANVASPALACGRHDGRLTRGIRLGGATWSSLPLDDALGVHALRSFYPGCRSAGCLHPTAPTCRSPKRPSRLSDFQTPGDRSFLPASGRSMAQPPAFRSCGTTDHGRSGSAPGFLPAAKPCRWNPFVPSSRYCLGLCLSQVCGHQPVRVLRLELQNTPSAAGQGLARRCA